MPLEPIQKVMQLLTEKQNVFLTGGAGVGKTTLTREVIRSFESESKKVAKLASTGMAATLIGGQTLHSFLDLGIASSVEELQQRGKVEISKKVRKLINAMELIVIDEISMVSAGVFDMVRLRLLQAEYTGALLVVGDFLQLPPVSRGYEPVRFAFESSAWARCAFEIVELTTVYRSSDKPFLQLLQAIRFGRVTEQEDAQLQMLVRPVGEAVDQYTFLYGKNASAHQHNRHQLACLDAELYSYDAQMIVHDEKCTEGEIERFVSDARILPKLELKVGAPVLFTRNAWNYFNGERGRVIRMEPQHVYVEKESGVVVKLEPVGMSKTRWEERTVDGKKEMIEVPIVTVYQFPITLAFAITIHKSQGMSIEDLVIETNEIFAPSQFYVAVSRAVSPHRLILTQPNRPWRNLAFVHQKAAAFVASIIEH